MAQIQSHRDGAVATVVISNPSKMNAMTPEMWSALRTALDAADADPAVRVIVLTGDGDKAFVSGADIGRLDPKTTEGDAPPEASMPYMSPLRCSKPVVAKIRGFCFGGGLGLAAACDIRFCSDDAQFRMPAARLGLGYSYVGIARFISILGAPNTFDLFMSARRFGAEDALRMGFVARAVGTVALDQVVADYCALVAENAPMTIAAAKRAIREFLKDPAKRDTAAVQAMIDACAKSEDLKEGRAAFMEKRKPVFRGR